MSFFLVPVINGVTDIDYLYLLEGIQTKDGTQCYVKLRSGYVVRPSWQEITEDEFNQVKESLLTPSE